MLELFQSSYIVTLLQITILNLVALASPGPDFAIATHNSILYGKRIGLLTALGITIGELFHLTYIILGFGVLITNNVWLLNAVKICGCAYLIFLGIKMLRSSTKNTPESYVSTKQLSHLSAITYGAITNITNPKAILFFVSIFSVVVDINTPFYVLCAYGIAILVTTFSWFALVSLFFSHPRLRNTISSYQHILEKVTGVFLILISIKLALTKELML